MAIRQAAYHPRPSVASVFQTVLIHKLQNPSSGVSEILLAKTESSGNSVGSGYEQSAKNRLQPSLSLRSLSHTKLYQLYIHGHGHGHDMAMGIKQYCANNNLIVWQLLTNSMLAIIAHRHSQG